MAYLDTFIRKVAFALMSILIAHSIASFAEVTGGYPEISFNQSMGLINIPTATLLKHGQMRASINTAVVSFGLFDYFEMGILAFNSGSKFYWGNRLAVKLIDEEGPWPAIAVGAESETENPHLKSARYFDSSYLVASKDMGIFGIGHIGIGNGRFIGSGEVSSRLNGLFCGIEKTFYEDSMNPMTFKLEEDGNDINFGIKYRLLPGFDLALTVARLDNWIFQHPAPDNNPVVIGGFICEGILSPVNRKARKND
jgi:hypothetical protein